MQLGEGFFMERFGKTELESKSISTDILPASVQQFVLVLPLGPIGFSACQTKDYGGLVSVLLFNSRIGLILGS